MIKKVLYKVLPKKIIQFLQKKKYMWIAKNAFDQDRKRFMSSVYSFNSSLANLEAQIIINSHSIEKGLTNINFRPGFGKRALSDLVYNMEKYSERTEVINSEVFSNAINIITAYIEKHNNLAVDVSYLKDIVQKFKVSSDLVIDCNVVNNSKSGKIKESHLDFFKFSNSRSSVRDYSSEIVSSKELTNVFSLANNAPSACNRQPWQVHVISDKNKITEVLTLQKGLKGYGTNIQKLLLITSDNRFFSNVHERNQGFIDAGMYSMNLLYAFKYYGIGTCALNAELSKNTEKLIRDILSIKNYENLVMFISVGKYPNDFKTTKSPKKSINSYIKYH
ncbi:hypothetical protein CI105_08150 [Candidatus Izimaplasma bacterium ZiA1]|uniref:nitroreductase family protein n=1 Tax=Candidatus Izimoplasma sp. ZiA1 TaxID=2024899 RepID=UPI000BAA5BA5|nr:hypothetical protein CI105_08150 [Candidatus Izimaplasma bacterium ZiA1]